MAQAFDAFSAVCSAALRTALENIERGRLLATTASSDEIYREIRALLAAPEGRAAEEWRALPVFVVTTAESGIVHQAHTTLERAKHCVPSYIRWEPPSGERNLGVWHGYAGSELVYRIQPAMIAAVERARQP